jgi:beta-glucanase (GH16 family)
MMGRCSGGLQVLNHAGTVFFDDFSGSSVNASKWEVYDRDSDLANSEDNAVRPQNATLSGGVLSILSEYIPAGITAHDSIAGDRTVFYASAQIATKDTFLYGTFDARIKPAGGTGIWPLFWMLGHAWQASQPFTANTPEHNWPEMTQGWWEIDIMEFLGGTRTSNNCAAHVNSSNTQQVALPFNATSRFMVYRLVWQPTYLRWYVDAEDGNGFVLLREITDTNYIPTNPGYLICHVAVGGAGGEPDSATFPLTSQYDYVRVTT